MSGVFYLFILQVSGASRRGVVENNGLLEKVGNSDNRQWAIAWSMGNRVCFAEAFGAVSAKQNMDTKRPRVNRVNKNA